MRMNVVPTEIPDLLVLELLPFADDRGFFMETWNRNDFEAAGIHLDFVQDNHSKSEKNTLRGLHYQSEKAPLTKLVRCTNGAIFDVAVDIRPSSATYGKWYGIELSAENKKMLLVPAGFAHGFLALTDDCEVQYKQTGFWNKEAEGAIIWSDTNINIQWPGDGDFIVSDKDKTAQTFQSYKQNPAFT